VLIHKLTLKIWQSILTIRKIGHIILLSWIWECNKSKKSCYKKPVHRTLLTLISELFCRIFRNSANTRQRTHTRWNPAPMRSPTSSHRTTMMSIGFHCGIWPSDSTRIIGLWETNNTIGDFHLLNTNSVFDITKPNVLLRGMLFKKLKSLNHDYARLSWKILARIGCGLTCIWFDFGITSKRLLLGLLAYSRPYHHFDRSGKNANVWSGKYRYHGEQSVRIGLMSFVEPKMGRKWILWNCHNNICNRENR